MTNLIELKEFISVKSNHPNREMLFVEAITSFLMNDETSPGEIDDDEAKWLLAKIQGDGQLDKTERALLENLKAKAKLLPVILNI